jgi:hypothetical protein
VAFVFCGDLFGFLFVCLFLVFELGFELMLARQAPVLKPHSAVHWSFWLGLQA